MKLVYNNCFGGFGLSPAGIMRYAELKGIPLVQKTEGHRTYFITESGESFLSYNIPRTDPALVQTVEELGSAANSSVAKLVVHELPAGTKYRIQEYDGNEWVETEADIEWQVAT